MIHFLFQVFNVNTSPFDFKGLKGPPQPKKDNLLQILSSGNIKQKLHETVAVLTLSNIFYVVGKTRVAPSPGMLPVFWPFDYARPQILGPFRRMFVVC